MKTQFYITALCCLIAGPVFAQQPTAALNEHTRPAHSNSLPSPGNRPTRQSLAKTTGTDTRLIAVGYYNANIQTQTFKPTDSTFHTYSGERGGNVGEVLLYDNYTHFRFNTQGNAYDNYYHYVQTFDGAGRRSNYLQREWNTNTQSWINKSQETYTYDAAGNLILSLSQKWDANSNIWNNYYRYSYTYDGLNQMTSSLVEKWNVNVWKNVDRDTYVFSDTLLTKHQWDVWDDNNNAWRNFYKYDYTYNGNGKCETETYSTWNTNANVWQFHQQKIFAYNNALQETGMLQKSWQNNAWKNYSRYSYNFSNTGQRLSALYEEWKNNAWVNTFRYDNTFDGQDRLSLENIQLWDAQTNTWKNYQHTLYDYDNNSNILSVTEKKPDANNNSIMNNDKIRLFTYNSNNKKTTETRKTWNLTQQMWHLTANDSRYHYHYETYTTAAAHQNKLAGTVKAYPNPASNAVQIEVQLERPAALTLVIMDIAGRKRLQVTYPAAARHQDHLDISSLAPGIYQVVIGTAEGQQTEKLVIMR